MKLVVRAGALAAAVALALTGTAHAHTGNSGAVNAPEVEQDAAYFAFEAPQYYSQEFIVKITKQDQIDTARALLNGQSDQTYIVGRIKKHSADYNPRWSFHYDPDTVFFATATIEVCDATTQYVEDHLDEAGGAFLPGLVWCPWSAKLTREISPS